jgi:hypothetical protein
MTVGEAVSVHSNSSDESLHVGFSDSISAIFLARVQPLMTVRRSRRNHK